MSTRPSHRNKDNRFMEEGPLQFLIRLFARLFARVFARLLIRLFILIRLSRRDTAQTSHSSWLAVAFGLGLCWTGTAHATVAVLQPLREAAAQQPLELTLL